MPGMAVSVRWVQADREAIQRDAGAGAWHSGHVNAVLTVGDPVTDVLVGADSGGVWRVRPPVTGPERSSPRGDDWDNPDVMCLARGVDGPRHVYAGCHGSYGAPEAIYETDPRAAEPLDSWLPVPPPAGIGTVHGIAADPATRRLVVAGAGGVWWTLVPGLQPGPRTYRWAQAFTQPCSGLAIVEPGFVPVVSTWGGASLVARGSWRRTIRGGWGLQFTAASTPALTSSAVPALGRSSIAVCASNRQRLYCVVSAAGSLQNVPVPPTIAGLVASADGGRTWTALAPTVVSERPGVMLASVAGQQGGYNNCIGVSPVDPDTVAVGWQAGTWLSSDGGRVFHHLDSVHLHADVHALAFEPADRSGATLYIGSDGGLAVTTDLGATFDTTLDRRLLTLQFATSEKRDFWGNFTGSPAVAGLVAGGAQDHGVLYAVLGHGPWRALTGGDGAGGVFIESGQLLLAEASANPMRIATWDPGTVAMGSPAVVPAVQRDGSTIAGLPDPAVEAVDHPGFQLDGETLYAIATGTSVAGGDPVTANFVYGLFAAPPASAGDAAADPTWRYLGGIPRNMTGWTAGSRDGTRVAVGAANPGYLYRVTPGTGAVPPLPFPPPVTAGQPDIASSRVTRIVELSDGTLLATYNNRTSGQILRLRPRDSAWTQLNGLPGSGLPNAKVFGLAADALEYLYAATDDRVYASDDGGDVWRPMSDGLPRRPHCGDVRAVGRPGLDVYGLYLATWGRSVWRATWTHADRPRPGEGGLAWNQLVGSLVDGHLYQVGPGGLRPVGPIDPELGRDAVTAFGDLGEAIRDLGAGLGELPGGELPPAAAARLALLDELHATLTLGFATLEAAAALGGRTGPHQARRLDRASRLVTGAARRVATAARQADAPPAARRRLADATRVVADRTTRLDGLAAKLAPRG